MRVRAPTPQARPRVGCGRQRQRARRRNLERWLKGRKKEGAPPPGCLQDARSHPGPIRPPLRATAADGRDKLTWLQVMLVRTWAALRRRCRRLPPPLVVADSWCGETELMAQVATVEQGTMLVEGKRSYVFSLPNGLRVKGRDLLSGDDWPWRDSMQVPGMRYAGLTATSPSYGPVTVVIAEPTGRDRYYLLATESAKCRRKAPTSGIWSCDCWPAWCCSIRRASCSRAT